MTEQDKQALIKHFCSRDCGEAAENCEIMPCWEIELIQEFSTTEPDPDTISRRVAISAICNACGKIDCDQADNCEKLQLPPANCSEFPNNSDTISRAKAIEAIAEAMRGLPVVCIDIAEEAIKQLPPAQPEIIYCKDCKKHNKHYHESPYKDTVCPLTAWRGKARGHEYDYQYCCYAERREVTT